jgi:hypothetical protein
MESLSLFNRSRGHGQGTAQTVARGLGWFSIGLGLAECLMPQTMARAVGLPGRENLMRAYGLREIATGVGILTSNDPEPWIWGRVAGDALDLATLSAGMHRDNPHLIGNAMAMLAVAQVTAIDLACGKALAADRQQQGTTRSLIDYRGRSGFNASPSQMRGAALSDFEMPADYRTPEALRPWSDHSAAVGSPLV